MSLFATKRMNSWFFYQAVDKETSPYLKERKLGHIFLYMPFVNIHYTLVSNAKHN